jgi:hypothetical protein
VLSSATRGAGTTTSGTSGLLTSLRDSGATSRRRSGDGDEEQWRRRGLGFRRARRKRRRRLGLGRGTLGGAAAALNRSGGGLGVRATPGGARGSGADSDSSPARVRREEGDDRWGPPVGSCGRGRGGGGLAAADWAGWAALWCGVATAQASQSNN